MSKGMSDLNRLTPQEVRADRERADRIYREKVEPFIDSHDIDDVLFADSFAKQVDALNERAFRSEMINDARREKLAMEQTRKNLERRESA